MASPREQANQNWNERKAVVRNEDGRVAHPSMKIPAKTIFRVAGALIVLLLGVRGSRLEPLVEDESDEDKEDEAIDGEDKELTFADMEELLEDEEADEDTLLELVCDKCGYTFWPAFGREGYHMKFSVLLRHRLHLAGAVSSTTQGWYGWGAWGSGWGRRPSVVEGTACPCQVVPAKLSEQYRS